MDPPQIADMDADMKRLLQNLLQVCRLTIYCLGFRTSITHGKQNSVLTEFLVRYKNNRGGLNHLL